MVGWQLVIIVFGIAVSLYKYIVYKGAEKEWGDGIRGLYLTTARYALYQIGPERSHTKNYRPQVGYIQIKTGNVKFLRKHILFK